MEKIKEIISNITFLGGVIGFILMFLSTCVNEGEDFKYIVILALTGISMLLICFLYNAWYLHNQK